MKNEIVVVFSPEAEEAYSYLKEEAVKSKTECMILKSVNYKIELIKMDSRYGNPVAKNLIPEEYKIKYGIKNLFRVELPCFWRMLYTLRKDETEIEIIAFVLDILDHPEYNKKLGYRDK